MDRFSVCIAGAGVIGLSIARQLSRSPRFQAESIVILDREAHFGQHTSSRNSEVIHAGIYYPHDSLKARFCVRGKHLLYEYCQRYEVPFNRIGKCIISKDSSSDSLEALRLRAEGNGVTDLIFWTPEQLSIAEPAINANYALFSPSTGIVDSHSYMQSLLHQAQAEGTLFAQQTEIREVIRLSDGFEVRTVIRNGENEQHYALGCDLFINCAGLEAQALAARIQGCKDLEIPELYPCKGDYFIYSGKNPFQHLIYPLPEPNTQGLGIHSTTDLSGQLRFGPDTEYVNTIDYNVDGSKSPDFAASISQYFPAIDASKLSPGYAGIRPKLAGPDMPVADFIIQMEEDHGVPGLVNLFGIESPGLTASLAIAEYVEAGL